MVYYFCLTTLITLFQSGIYTFLRKPIACTTVISVFAVDYNAPTTDNFYPERVIRYPISFSVHESPIYISIFPSNILLIYDKWFQYKICSFRKNRDELQYLVERTDPVSNKTLKEKDDEWSFINNYRSTENSHKKKRVPNHFTSMKWLHIVNSVILNWNRVYCGNNLTEFAITIFPNLVNMTERTPTQLFDSLEIA